MKEIVKQIDSIILDPTKRPDQNYLKYRDDHDKNQIDATVDTSEYMNKAMDVLDIKIRRG